MIFRLFDNGEYIGFSLTPNSFQGECQEESVMFDVFAFEPSAWLGESVSLTALGAFTWGLGSALLSPCHLGIIPLLGSHAAGCGPFAASGSAVGKEVEKGTPPTAQAFLFTLGCFATIPLIGLVFALLGHGLELGGHWWTLPVGALLLWFGVDMFRSHSCAHASHIWNTLRRRLGISAVSGVFALGFGYGLLASGCTLGFLTPLLVLTLPQGVFLCTFFAACFGLGHCLPMAVVGCSAPLARRLLGGRHSHHEHGEDSHQAGDAACSSEPHLHEPHSGEALFRRIMGGVLVLIAIAFMLHPFLE